MASRTKNTRREDYLESLQQQTVKPTVETRTNRVIRDPYAIARQQRRIALSLPGILQEPKQPAKLSTPEPAQKQALQDKGVSPPKKTKQPEKPITKLTTEKKRCKTQPKSNKGNGTARKFVPWCNKT